MRPRDVLAENLQKLMAATPAFSTLPAITKAGGGSNGTLDRIRRKTHATSVDSLAALAEVFGVEPWLLLLPDLAVDSGSVRRPQIQGQLVWPLDRVEMRRYMALSDEDKAYVQGKLEQAIENCEARSTRGLPEVVKRNSQLIANMQTPVISDSKDVVGPVLQEYARRSTDRLETAIERAERQARELMGVGEDAQEGSVNRRGGRRFTDR